VSGPRRERPDQRNGASDLRGLFVTGTDTGIGKTVLSAALMSAVGKHVVYWKPVQTGVGDEAAGRSVTGGPSPAMTDGAADAADDSATVRRLAGLDAGRIVDEGYRFREPASPHHAAALENASIDPWHLVEIGRRHGRAGRRFVVEGAGGLLVPLNDSDLMTDLIRLLGLPILLASSTRLGTINHTLLSLREIERRRLPAIGVVLIGPADRSAEGALERHAGLPILGRLPWIEPLDRQALAREGTRLLSIPALRDALAPGEAPGPRQAPGSPSVSAPGSDPS